MLEELDRLCREYAMLPPGGRVLCALSGGPDSVCLLHALRERAEKGGFTLAAAHYDHGLRGAASREDAAFCRDLCQQWGIPFYTEAGDVAARAAAEGRGLEETGRDLRYDFLCRAAEEAGAAVIATAHNADDNAETLLLNLIRGSGLRGLTGIPPRRGNIVRPLLTTTRGEILAYLHAFDLPFRRDESNDDCTFARNRIRRQVMPVLADMNPQAVAHMSRTIARLRQDNDILTAQAARTAALARPAGEALVLSATALGDLPQGVAVRCASLVLRRLGLTQVRAAHLEGVVALARGADPSARLRLPGVEVRRVYGDLLFAPAGEEGEIPPPREAALPGETPWGAWYLTVTPCVAPEEGEAGVWYLDREALAGPLTVRGRREGDHLTLPGRPGKTVKKWMIEYKIPRALRDGLPVLSDGEGVVAAAGLGVHRRAAARPGRPAWAVKLERDTTGDNGKEKREHGTG